MPGIVYLEALTFFVHLFVEDPPPIVSREVLHNQTFLQYTVCIHTEWKKKITKSFRSGLVTKFEENLVYQILVHCEL